MELGAETGISLALVQRSICAHLKWPRQVTVGSFRVSIWAQGSQSWFKSGHG